MSNTDGGILAGGGLGAAAGALVGGQRGHAGTGALVGGALGAVAGGITGSAIDRSERRATQAAQAAAVAQQPPLAVADVIRLTQSGLSDDVIINQIRTTGSRYNLSADDLTALYSAGVREAVIREMQATASRPVRYVQPVAVAQPVVVYPVEPPPPVGVGFGVTYVRRRW
jgi:hypothetical protein